MMVVIRCYMDASHSLLKGFLVLTFINCLVSPISRFSCPHNEMACLLGLHSTLQLPVFNDPMSVFNFK